MRYLYDTYDYTDAATIHIAGQRIERKKVRQCNNKEVKRLLSDKAWNNDVMKNVMELME